MKRKLYFKISNRIIKHVFLCKFSNKSFKNIIIINANRKHFQYYITFPLNILSGTMNKSVHSDGFWGNFGTIAINLAEINCECGKYIT